MPIAPTGRLRETTGSLSRFAETGQAACNLK
jgi:hypothetical protein